MRPDWAEWNSRLKVIFARPCFVFHEGYFPLWQVVKEDIAPTLDKLREERSSYLEYQKIVREVEHLSKLCVAHQFVCAEVINCRWL